MSYEREINWNITGKDRKDVRIAELEARVKELEAELDSFSRGVRIQVPTATMGQEFLQHYRRGYVQAKKESRQQVERLVEALEKIEAHEARRMYETCPDCDSESICTTSKRCRIKSFVQRIASEALAAVEKERT